MDKDVCTVDERGAVAVLPTIGRVGEPKTLREFTSRVALMDVGLHPHVDTFK